MGKNSVPRRAASKIEQRPSWCIVVQAFHNGQPFAREQDLQAASAPWHAVTHAPSTHDHIAAVTAAGPPSQLRTRESHYFGTAACACCDGGAVPITWPMSTSSSSARRRVSSWLGARLRCLNVSISASQSGAELARTAAARRRDRAKKEGPCRQPQYHDLKCASLACGVKLAAGIPIMSQQSSRQACFEVYMKSSKAGVCSCNADPGSLPSKYQTVYRSLCSL